MEVLKGRIPVLITEKGQSDIILLNSFYEIEGFHLKAFNELESYFDPPAPFLEIDLTSAAVIARVINSNSILLVEFLAKGEERRVELPAGKVNKNLDLTIFDTAKREFHEETGGMIETDILLPLSVVPHTDKKGGLQFFTEISEPLIAHRDDFGRGYITPLEGTDKGRVLQLITEPLDVFLNPERTLLRYSRNQWAVDINTRLTLGIYIKQSDKGSIK